MDLYLVSDTNTSITFFFKNQICSFVKQECCLSHWHLAAIRGAILNVIKLFF